MISSWASNSTTLVEVAVEASPSQTDCRGLLFVKVQQTQTVGGRMTMERREQALARRYARQ